MCLRIAGNGLRYMRMPELTPALEMGVWHKFLAKKQVRYEMGHVLRTGYCNAPRLPWNTQENNRRKKTPVWLLATCNHTLTLDWRNIHSIWNMKRKTENMYHALLFLFTDRKVCTRITTFLIHWSFLVNDISCDKTRKFPTYLKIAENSTSYSHSLLLHIRFG